MPIEVLDPTNEDAPEAVALAARLTSLRGTTVGLLSNGKAGTARLFDHMEALLRGTATAWRTSCGARRATTRPRPRTS